MSKTLFWYVFKDLLRIFLLTSGVLAGIMSFCGLLRPLTEQGLDAWQVGRMLSYLMPATQTYSLPVAALFATAVVYGRLAADNELTACRASGITYLSMAAPALVLGLGLALVSLLSLSFIVPYYSLKVERVIFSNLAQIVQSDIEKSHQMRVGGASVFAQGARVESPDPSRPGEQVVTLDGPMFVTYEPDRSRTNTRIPREFCTASTAWVYITPGDDDVQVSAVLKDGTRFPADMKGGVQAAVGTAQFGPVSMDSPVRESAKFMDIRRLKELYTAPEYSKRVRAVLSKVIRGDQEMTYLDRLMGELNRRGICRLTSGADTWVLIRGDVAASLGKGSLVIPSPEGADLRQVRLEHQHAGETLTLDTAQAATVRVQADRESGQFMVGVELIGAVVGGDAAKQSSFTRQFTVPMPADILAKQSNTAQGYLRSLQVSATERNELKAALTKVTNGIQSELHARVSFAVSCLILVVMGCALGMMFHSGNFLTAFAVSAAPALLSIALVVTGQHVAETSPGSLNTGLALIWSGNVLVLILAIVLMSRLQRE